MLRYPGTVLIPAVIICWLVGCSKSDSPATATTPPQTTARVAPVAPTAQTKATKPSVNAPVSSWESTFPADGADGRRAAEWVLGLGGKLSIVEINRKSGWLPSAELPEGPFYVSGIMLSDNPNAIDDGLSQLSALKRLNLLQLDGSRLTDAGVERLKDVLGLRELNLRNTQVTGAGLEYLGNLRELKVLRLTDSKLNDAGLLHLVKLPELSELHLDGTSITDQSLISIGRMPKIELLVLGNIQVSGAGLSHLEGLRSLTGLVLNHLAIVDESLAPLSKLASLKRLGLV